MAEARPAGAASDRGPLPGLAIQAVPPLLFGLRLSASVCLALYLAFWLQLDAPGWAGTSAAMVCQPQLGASLRKGWFRMLGTIAGAVVAVAITAAFPQDRALFLIALTLWGGACAVLATLLRNFAAYAAGLAALTTAVIAADQLGATGGPDGQAFMLGVMRVTEVCLGIVGAGVVLAATDLGGAQRRLAAILAAVIADIAADFAGTLRGAGPDLPDTRPARREFVRRVIALDPVIDQAIGESTALRNRSLTLQAAMAGGLAALGGWRAAALRLRTQPAATARADAAAILACLPPWLADAIARGRPRDWLARPAQLDDEARKTAQDLRALPAGTPSRRLLADQAARSLTGLADAVNGLALLVDGHARSPAGLGRWQFQVADWLPALINGGRAVATIAAILLFWIATAWPQGAVAMIWAAVIAILFAPRADQAYAGAADYMIGNAVAAVGTAVIGFAILPAFTGFVAFALVISLYLVPAGALLASGWRPSIALGMVGSFVPFLSPTNAMGYDWAAFWNNASALFIGVGIAMAGFRLLPPPSPGFLAARLLRLSLRDLRRLAAGAAGWTADRWAARIYSRLAALPDAATPLHRARLLVTLDIGEQALALRQAIRAPGPRAMLDAALAAIARGDSDAAIIGLTRLDDALAIAGPAMLRARGGILAITEALADHAAFFDAGAPR